MQFVEILIITKAIIDNADIVTPGRALAQAQDLGWRKVAVLTD